MSISSRVLARLLHLRPPATRTVRIERDLRVRMRDGIVLIADRYIPLIEDAPVVLTRTPYGRRAPTSWIARLIAERGYQVVVQSCRGTHGSGGVFEPFRNEEADGLDTLEWLGQQPWFTGVAGTHGGSYVGTTQWALSGAGHPWLRAMALAMTSSQIHDPVVYPFSAFALETSLSWAVGQESQPDGAIRTIAQVIKLSRKLRSAWHVLPLSDADSTVLGAGRHVEFYQQWLRRQHDDDWWRPTDHREKRASTDAAVHMLAGWHDFFLPWQLDDFLVLQSAGREVHLTIGPWAHGGGADGIGRELNGALEWFDHHLRGLPLAPKSPIRAQVGGRWLEFETWPPPADELVLRLQPDGGLAESMPPDSQADTYSYNPADPTPSAGGPSLSGEMGKDQVARENRSDVLCYTSAPLERPLTLIGPARADLYVASDAETVDFVVTVCDVDERNRSSSVSIGLVRTSGASLTESAQLRVPLWPIGHEFQPGHRVRVQIASAAHPLYARNLGVEQPLATGSATRASTQRVYHDPDRSSAVRLPHFSR